MVAGQEGGNCSNPPPVLFLGDGTVKGTLWDDPICSIDSCPAGQVGGWGYQYRDGPCRAQPCGWPAGRPTRDHFTNHPAPPVVDAGKEALLRARVLLKGTES